MIFCEVKPHGILTEFLLIATRTDIRAAAMHVPNVNVKIVERIFNEFLAQAAHEAVLRLEGVGSGHFTDRLRKA